MMVYRAALLWCLVVGARAAAVGKFRKPLAAEGRELVDGLAHVIAKGIKAADRFLTQGWPDVRSSGGGTADRLRARQSAVEERVRALFCTPEAPCYRAEPLPLEAKEPAPAHGGGVLGALRAKVRPLLRQAVAATVPREWMHAHAQGATCYGSGSAEQPAKLTIVTLASGLPAHYTRVMREGRLREAERYGYEYCEYGHPLESSRDVAWSKVVTLRVLLEHGRPQVAWIDADAVFVRPQPFEDITSPFFDAGKSAVFTNELTDKGAAATPHSPINSGVFVVKNTPWSAKFWQSIWEDFPEAIDHPWWDQQAILLYRKRHFEDFSANVQIVQHRLMNTWLAEVQEGSAPHTNFIVHAAGGHHVPGKFEDLLSGTTPLA